MVRRLVNTRVVYQKNRRVHSTSGLLGAALELNPLLDKGFFCLLAMSGRVVMRNYKGSIPFLVSEGVAQLVRAGEL